MLFQVGGFEVLLSDSIDAWEKAVAAGCEARITVYPEMFHEFQMSMNLIPESKKAWEEAEGFVRERFGLPERGRNNSRKLRMKSFSGMLTGS